MLSKLLNHIKNIFTITEQQMLDDFITSNQPKTVSEVEHWIKVYDQRKLRSQSVAHWN
jgi:hypothetical protein